MWGFQLWVNLPAKDKMVPPRYQDIPAARIPVVRTDEGVVRVLAGTYGGETGPVEGVATRPTMLDADVADGATIVLPAPRGQNAFAYAFEGTPRIGGEPVPRGHLAILGAGDGVEVTGPGRVLLLSGTPLREPVARHGPFVMNTREQIAQAFDDFRAGRFGG
jgi:redox-sensitive bicupin YhaK (pirin superfamily)